MNLFNCAEKQIKNITKLSLFTVTGDPSLRIRSDTFLKNYNPLMPKLGDIMLKPADRRGKY